VGAGQIFKGDGDVPSAVKRPDYGQQKTATDTLRAVTKKGFIAVE